jgi:hypothetical protein
VSVSPLFGLERRRASVSVSVSGADGALINEGLVLSSQQWSFVDQCALSRNEIKRR